VKALSGWNCPDMLVMKTRLGHSLTLLDGYKRWDCPVLLSSQTHKFWLTVSLVGLMVHQRIILLFLGLKVSYS